MNPAVLILLIIMAAVVVWLLWGCFAARPRPPRWYGGAADPAEARVATRITELAAHAEDPGPTAEAAAHRSVIDAEKARLRAAEGGRVRLRGAVVDGALRIDALQAILLAPRSPGEHAKATRVLLHFFPLHVAAPVLKRGLLALGPDFLPMARRGFDACRMSEEVARVAAAAGPADEGWMLGALPFADPASQRALGQALARVGGRRSLEAMRLLASEGQAPAWVDEVRAALRARLAEAGGGLSVSVPSGAEGGLSPTSGGGLSPTDDPGGGPA